MSLIVISATIQCKLKRAVCINDLSIPNHIKTIDGPSKITIVSKNGRACIENGSLDFLITSVRDVDLALLDFCCILQQPFEARIISLQNRFKIKKPKFFYARSLKKFDAVNSSIRARTDIFGNSPFITFVHSYQNVPCKKYNIWYNEDGKRIVDTMTFEKTGKTLINMFPSGQMILKGKCLESNKNTLKEFCEWFEKM
jgi:hypothetical protein